MQYQDKFFFQQQKLNTLGLKMQNYSFRKKEFLEHFRAWKKWWIFHVLLKRKEINCAEFSPRKENKKWKKMSTFSQQMMHFEATTNDELEISLPHDWRSEFSWCTWLTEQQASLSITNHHLLMSIFTVQIFLSQNFETKLLEAAWKAIKLLTLLLK